MKMRLGSKPYIEMCREHLERIVDVPGDVLECGVYQGDNYISMLKWCAEHAPQRRVIAFDTFRGLTEPTEQDGEEVQAGECYSPLVTLAAALQAEGARRYTIWQGDAAHDLGWHLRSARLAFVWLDMDLYAPTLRALVEVDRYIECGGIVGCHDYGYSRLPGVKRAVDEWAAANQGVYELACPVEYDSIFFRRVI